MRTTIRLDDDLFIKLKEQARRENISLGELLNRTLRAGIKASHQQKTQKLCYREKTVSMGVPQVDLDKALSLAATFEDEEIIRKIMLRK